MHMQTHSHWGTDACIRISALTAGDQSCRRCPSLASPGFWVRIPGERVLSRSVCVRGAFHAALCTRTAGQPGQHCSVIIQPLMSYNAMCSAVQDYPLERFLPFLSHLLQRNYSNFCFYVRSTNTSLSLQTETASANHFCQSCRSCAHRRELPSAGDEGEEEHGAGDTRVSGRFSRISARSLRRARSQWYRLSLVSDKTLKNPSSTTTKNKYQKNI